MLLRMRRISFVVDGLWEERQSHGTLYDYDIGHKTQRMRQLFNIYELAFVIGWFKKKKHSFINI